MTVMPSVWARPLALLGQRPAALASLVALSLLASIAEGLGIGLLIPLLDGFGGAPSGGSALGAALARFLPSEPGGARVVALCAAIATLLALRTAVVLTYQRAATAAIARAAAELRTMACTSLLAMPYPAYAQLDRGRGLNTLDAQVYQASEALLTLLDALNAAITAAVLLALLLALSWQTALIAMLAALPAHLAVRVLARASRRAGAKVTAAHFGYAERAYAMLAGLRTIHMFGAEGRVRDRLANDAERHARAFRDSERINQAIAPVGELLYLPCFLAVLLYGWHAGLPTPLLIASLLLLYRAQPALKRLDHARVSLAALAATMDAFDTLIALGRPPARRAEQEPALGPLRHAVAFDAVGFRYRSDGPPVLDGVSFAIEAGAVVVLLGRSGAGKSTLVNVLFGLCLPSEGALRVDGAPLAAGDLPGWRRQLAFAGQDADLLPGSLRDNVALARPDASDAEVREALRRSHALEFVEPLPAGLATAVGAGGIALSAGQRQRIAIARALLTRPRLLVLDEATSGLDERAELALLEELITTRGETALLIITHRSSMLRLADRVVLLERGRVTAAGRPAQVATDPAYGRVLGEIARDASG